MPKLGGGHTKLHAPTTTQKTTYIYAIIIKRIYVLANLNTREHIVKKCFNNGG